MLNNKDISVVGSDKRLVYMCEKLAKDNNFVYSYGADNNFYNKKIKVVSSLKEVMANGEIIVCPIPFTKDNKSIAFMDLYEDKEIEDFLSLLNKKHTVFTGLAPKYLLEYCRLLDIGCFDFMSMNNVAILNGIATAEGAIAEGIRRSIINIHQSNCLVLGYGRCGVVLADKLKGLGAKVSVCARNKDSVASAQAIGHEGIILDFIDEYLGKFDFIFNTIPFIILNKNRLQKLSKNVTVIDIASLPGGVDYQAAKQEGINATLCLGLPGMYSPKISGEILANVIEDFINEGKW